MNKESHFLRSGNCNNKKKKKCFKARHNRKQSERGNSSKKRNVFLNKIMISFFRQLMLRVH